MCCSGPSCANYKCRCICMRCRVCELCSDKDSSFGHGLAIELMTGDARAMAKKASKVKPNTGLPPQDRLPSPRLQRPGTESSQSQSLVKAVRNNCAHQ
ncbi:hypothetical protein LSH36_184g02015 [Paralvinella palmiformis]|uniref:Uncharacterized protein n=1 Tax=Paralvinella palmiformis TaxID=53620 RepID=A0AAD9N5S0_9ANNE|nr:hypothetical protein LSH36_184g02015 [Paralvinella palmiformis]